MLLDDAAGIPPVENAKLYARMGVDSIAFPAAKGLRGPQCSGLLLGRKDLIEAALLNCSPREGAVCRPMKVGKEEVIGCLTALETWLNMDEKKLYAEWNEPHGPHPQAGGDRARSKNGYLRSRRWKSLSHAKVSWDQQAGDTRFPIACESFAPAIRYRSARSGQPSLVKAVREGNPNPSQRAQEPDHIELVSMTIKPGEEIIVGQRLRDILGAAQKKAQSLSA